MTDFPYFKMKIVEAKTRLLAHSKAKIELYSIYLSIYLNIIERDAHTEKIYLYDLFCGEGKYSDGSRGSPLAALDVIKKHFFENGKKIKPIRFLLNDEDADKIEKLTDLVKANFKPNNCNLEIKNEDYSDLIDNVIDEIGQYKNEKGLIFIDPYGYKHINILDLQNLLEGKKTEVILFLPISFMYRFAGAVSLDDLPGYEPLKKFLEELFQKEKQDFSSVNEFISKLKIAFRNKLGDYYIDTFTLERDSSNLYCLLFFTSHIRGFEKMMEAKWKMDEQEGRGFILDKQGKLFTRKELDDFPNEVKEFIKSTKKCTNKDLYKFGLIHGYLPKHLREILCQFQDEGLLHVSSENGEKVRRGAFFLDYNNHSPFEKRIVTIKIIEENH